MRRILAVSALLVFFSPVSGVTAGEITGTASVTDGDTIEIHDRDIRLHGEYATAATELVILFQASRTPW
jgi:endonuclease YncB( thermonuclease family)